MREKTLEKILDSIDWQGLAEAHNDWDKGWHKKEWTEFIHRIRASLSLELQKKILKAKKVLVDEDGHINEDLFVEWLEDNDQQGMYDRIDAGDGVLFALDKVLSIVKGIKE